MRTEASVQGMHIYFQPWSGDTFCSVAALFLSKKDPDAP
jgi:hypothetical protein